MIHADYINSDRLRLEMFATRTYSEREKKAVYDAMLQIMKSSLYQRKNLVLDATFSTNEKRAPFIKEFNDRKDVFFIEVHSSETITIKRLKQKRPYSEADYAIYQLILQQWEPLEQDHLLLESTDENISIMMQKAAAYLRLKDDKSTDQ